MGVVLARITGVKALLISGDANLREVLKVALRSVERRTGEPWQYLEAPDGVVGIRLAWRERPDVVVADEIASRAGAFAVAKDLKGAMEPFRGAVVIVLARRLDAWLAEWSGADAWVARPVDPFSFSDTLMDLIGRKEPV